MIKSTGRSRIADGLPPVELWGVSQRDRKTSRKKRGAAALLRRKAKRIAKSEGKKLCVVLKKLQAKS